MLRSSFSNDPFFDGHSAHMRQMDQMFDDSFGVMGRRQRMALPEGQHQHRNTRNRQVAERGMFMDPFSHFDSMFSNMHSMMSDMRRTFADGAQPHGDSHVYQQSSFTSYSKGGDGAPKVYQASSSSKQGPNGVRETKKTVCDSEAGIDKIAVGHHIRDRGHVIERSRNNRTGNMNENQEYINLDEEDVTSFDQEYRDKWQSTMRGIDQRRHAERTRHAPVGVNRRHLALPEPEARRPRKASNRRE